VQITLGKQKKRRPLRRLLVVSLAIALLPLAFFWLINQQWLLAHILRTVNFGSDTKIALMDFKWNPLTSRIELKGLGIHHIPKNRDAWAQNISIRYRPIGLLRGKLIIGELNIQDVNVIIPPGIKEKKEKRRLNISRLLLLHSLIIEKASINNITVSFGKDSTFRADELRWSLDPSITGDTTLVLDGDSVSLYKAVKPILLAQHIALETSTRLSRWYADFPYINSMRGDLSSYSMYLQKLPIDQLYAKLSYQDGQINLKELKLTIEGNDLVGSVDANINTESFKLNIDIPKPIHLPYIGKEIKVLNTEGHVVGHIEAEGEGLILSDSKGKGIAQLNYQFAAASDWPIDIDTGFSWNKGRISINKGAATVVDSSLNFDGFIDIAKKQMNFDAAGMKFPLEALFEIFTNPHLQKIYGKTDFEGNVGGWGKKFIATVKGTTYEGGFKPMVGERIETDFTATYDKLQFAWKVYQGGNQTGIADFTLLMGPKAPGVDRRKTLDLDASITGHELEPTFPGFNLTGKADGHIILKGPSTNFTGEAHAKVIQGSWLGVDIDEAITDIELTRPKLTFKNIELKPSTINKIVFPEPLFMDLPEGRLRLHGDPIEGLSLALIYNYDSKTTTIEKLSYDPPDRPGEHIDLAGRIVSGGSIDLRAEGRFGLSLIEPAGALVREAAGPVKVDLRATGSSASPAVNGSIVLQNSTLSPRAARLAMEELNGTIRFEGHRIYFDGVKGLIQDGEFALSGWLEHKEYGLSSANIELTGRDLSLRTARDTFRMEFDGKLALKGNFPNPLLSGDINILDGRYTKDFVLLEQLGGGARKRFEEDEEAPTFDPRLDLTIRNTGDLLIRNNVGDIDLQADIIVKGSRTKPVISGSINTREGKINYLGLGFEITKGFIEFREQYSEPYLEVDAQRELRLYNLNLRLYGYIDNLRLDLEGTSPTGPLEKRDIVSLLTSGVTEQERRETQYGSREQLGVSVAAQQVGQMLERPISEMTHLDIFRIEAAEPEDTDEPGKVATRLRVGKQLTDRLSIDFSTDIDTKDAEQTVTAEYLVTDNIIIKGSRGSDSHYRFRGGLRFRLR